MIKELKICFITIVFTGIYIISSVIISNVFFFNKANGSLVKLNNRTIGSRLIGQEFKSNIYFHNRKSLTGYKNDISGNSNFPFYSTKLKDEILRTHHDFIQTNENEKPDLNIITESASGLDPHLTYEGALSQVKRISRTSRLSNNEIISLINKNAKPFILGLFGKRIINVLDLNLELEKNYAKTSRSR